MRDLNKWLRELKKRVDATPWPDYEETPLRELRQREQPRQQVRQVQPGRPGQLEEADPPPPSKPKEAPKSLPPCSSHYDPDAVCWLGDSSPPIWIPVGEGAAFVPTDVRHAAITMVQPFYEQHVNNSDDSIERMLATTVAYLMWNELLEQHDQKREYSHIESVIGLAGHRGSIIDQQLKIIDRKLRIAAFFLKLREKRDDDGRSRQPAYSPEHEQLRQALAKAVSAMPAEAPAKPQAAASPAAVAPPTKSGSKAEWKSPFAGTLEDRDRPTIGPRNLALDPHESRTLTQITLPTHTTGEKGSAAKGENRSVRCSPK